MEFPEWRINRHVRAAATHMKASTSGSMYSVPAGAKGQVKYYLSGQQRYWVKWEGWNSEFAYTAAEWPGTVAADDPPKIENCLGL